MGGDIYIPPKPEYKYALWYFKYTNTYEKEFNGTVDDLLNRGFNYAVALEVSEGSGTPESGNSREDGEKDGKEFGEFINSELSGIKYIAQIPYYKPGMREKLKNASEEQEEYYKKHIYLVKRTLEYWKGWIDGVIESCDSNLVGFYWNFESSTQINSGFITDWEIAQLSTYIKQKSNELNRKLEFIWIPYINDIENPDNNNIKRLSKYFDYVFVQPHYYIAWKYKYLGNKDNRYSEYINRGITKLIEVLNWVKEIPNGYIEMEVDETIDKDNCYDLINKACDYIRAREFLTGRDIWQIRAYYFGTNIENVDKVRNGAYGIKGCKNW